jgi:hypothetical protein
MDVFLHVEFRFPLSDFGMGPLRLAVNSVGEPQQFISSRRGHVCNSSGNHALIAHSLN